MAEPRRRGVLYAREFPDRVRAIRRSLRRRDLPQQLPALSHRADRRQAVAPAARRIGRGLDGVPRLLSVRAAAWLRDGALDRRASGTRARRRRPTSRCSRCRSAQLSLAVNPSPRADPAHPISSVLWLLTILIGVPFVTLSATSPLLQAWYARSRQPTRRATPVTPAQPYRLFAISNVGSLMSLLVYPWFIEPRMTLRGQTLALAGWFSVLAIVCGAIAWSIAGIPCETAADPSADAIRRRCPATSASPLAVDRARGLWIAAPLRGDEPSQPERRDDSAALDRAARRVPPELRRRVLGRAVAPALARARHSARPASDWRDTFCITAR